MANPVWPAGLPQMPLWDGWSETIRNQTVETPMDVGPAKVRRRTTVDIRDITACYKLTDAQKTTFVSFLNDTLAGGALRMDWPHPILGTKVARIKVKDGVGIGDKMAPNAWRIMLALEVVI